MFESKKKILVPDPSLTVNTGSFSANFVLRKIKGRPYNYLYACSCRACPLVWCGAGDQDGEVIQLLHGMSTRPGSENSISDLTQEKCYI